MRNVSSYLFFILTLCFVMCGGCTDDAPQPKAKDVAVPNVGMLLYTHNDVYIGLVADHINKMLEGKATLTSFYAYADQVVQNEQLDKLLDKKIDVLLANLVDPQMASEALNAVRKAGIPVIFFNRSPDLMQVKKYAKAAYVGTDAEQAGEMQGELIYQIWKKNPAFDRNKDNVCQYIMLQGNSDSAEAILRTETSIKQAVAKGMQMRQLGETYVCNWSREQGKQAVRLAMELYKDQIEFIVSNNDSMALGAIEVLKEHGFNSGDPQKRIPIVGVDAIPEACEAVKKGIMSATVMQDAAGMADAVVRLALNAVSGKDFLEGTPYSWDNTGVAVRIPYQSFTP